MIIVKQFTGTEASVNAFTLSNEQNVIAVDLLRNSVEAKVFADQISASGKNLTSIFITHGHPDHYLGLGVFNRQFPKVPVYVATQEIKDDIIGFTTWMESVGWLEAEPLMKVRTDKNPDGFDYANVLKVIDSNILILPGSSEEIVVKADYPGSEADHMATLAIPSQKTLLASDLIYDGVHAWCGSGVDVKAINEWIAIVKKIKSETSPSWIFYPGHGTSGNHQKLDNIASYLETFLKVTANAKSRGEAIEAMTDAFPNFAQSDFLLVHSVAFHVNE
jgi:glyoxylase-like metal-dependent hydrolase (beta-lactamase superfamily II)